MNDKEFNDFIAGILDPPIKHVPTEKKTLKDIFNERLKEMNLSQRQIEDFLGIRYRSLIGILNGTAKRVDVINLIKLSHFLGITADKMLSHYTKKEMNSYNIGSLERSRKHSFLANNFDLSILKKEKFISTVTDIESIERRIIDFFGFKDIFEYESEKIFPVFSRPKRDSNEVMSRFWVKSAFAHFKEINNPNAYSREALVDLMPKIRPYTRNVEKGFLAVVRALYNIGVTVIYQPHITGVQAYGATFVVNGKPCVVVSNLNKSYPTLWFAFIHELYHVLYDIEDISQRTYHLTGVPDVFLVHEDKANQFARNYLFPKESTDYISPFIKDDFIVNKYAEKLEIHPSIIHNCYLWDRDQEGLKLWGTKNKENFPNVSDALRNWNNNLWEGTIEENVKIIHETVFSNL